MKMRKISLNTSYVFYGTAFLIPAICMLGVCILMGITPFGKESFLIADMQKQYVDYLSYYKTIFRGENNIFYTFGKCLGGDMIGFYTYYLMSPFNLLFLFLKDKWIPAGITILVIVRTGLCGSTMAYYLKNRFQTENRAEIFLFSTSYAMMGYLCVNSFNVMWQDALVLLPCVLYGIDKILFGKKPYTYLVALFGVLFTNYYIGYMICIACVLYLGYRLLSAGKCENLLKKLWRFAYASLLAGGLCAAALVPTFLTLQGSLKDAKDVGVGITLPNLRLVRVLSKVFTMAYSENELMNGMPVIFCGILMLALVILFFMNTQIPVRERILSGCMLSVIMASFCLAKVDYVWHAFMEPSGYHYRYSFLFSFFMITFSWQGFLHIKDGINTKRLLLAGAVFLVLLFAIFRHPYEYISIKKALPDVVLFFVILAVVYLIYKGKNYRNLVLLLALLQIGNLSVNSGYTYMKNRNTSYCNAEEYAESVEKIRPVIEAVKADDSSLYRMENLEKRNNNDSMHFSYAGLTHYSSNEKNFVLFFLEKMGLNYNRLYAEYGNGTTQTVDSLLGVKYLVGSEETINKSYPAVLQQEELNVYQNPYALPIGFLAKEQIRSVDMEQENPFVLQNAMYQTASGSDETILKNAVVKGIQIENCTEEKQDNLTLYRQKEENSPIRVTYELETVEEGSVYAYLTAGEHLQAAEIYVNEEFLCGYMNRANWKILNLGEFEKGEHINFTIQLDGEELWLENAYFVTEDEKALALNYEQIMKEPVAVEQKSSSYLTVTEKNAEERLLVFSIPYEEDWQIMVDGEKRSGEKVYDTLLAIQLEPGEHNITLRYVPRGMTAGIVISIGCGGILICMLCYERRLKGRENHDKQRTA